MDERTFGEGQRYVALEQVGEGGMALVYKVKDTRLGDRLCAVKVLRGNLTNAAKPRRRFLAEARVMAGTSHPNLVVVHDAGEENGEPYMVMEFVEGRDLEAVATAFGALPPRVAVDIVVAVARALGAVHRRGVVHRDIKPNNVMMTLDGTPKVMDFGIAHLDDEHFTKTQDMMGTRGYMAPEQIMDPSRVDGRADLFALVVMLVRLVLGTESSFYEPSSIPKVVARLPEALRSIVNGGTKFQRDERAFKNAAQLVQALLAARELLPPDESMKFYARLSGEEVVDTTVPVVREISGDTPNEPERPLDPYAVPDSRIRVVGPVAAVAQVSAVVAEVPVPVAPMVAEQPPAASLTRGFTAFFSGESAADESSASPEAREALPVRPNWGRRLRVPAMLVGAVSVMGVLMYVGWNSGPASSKPVEEASVVVTPTVVDVQPVLVPSEPLAKVDGAAGASGASLAPTVTVPTVAPVVRPVSAPKPIVTPPLVVVEKPVEMSPIEAAPTPKPEGTIRVSGTGVTANLVSSAGTFKPGTVPPGSYTVEATFEDGSTFKSDFRVTVADGQEVTIPCSAKFKNCRAP